MATESLSLRARALNLELKDQEEKVLAIGETSTTQYVAGGVTGTLLGFGIGHAVQGRYTYDGWKFTLGQGVALTAVVVGATGCVNNAFDSETKGCSGVNEGLLFGGLVTLFAFRIWELIDIWATPPSYNRMHRDLEKYIQEQEAQRGGAKVKASLHLNPVIEPNTGRAGLGLQLRF